MKAWILEHQKPIDERPLTLREIADPHPRERELRVKVSVCGICRTDLHIAEGDLPSRRASLVLGHEVVGVVDEVGAGVRRFQVGDRVGISWIGRTCGTCKHCRGGRENYCTEFRATGWDLDGGFAEHAVVAEDSALSLEGVALPDDQLAPMMCPGVAGYCALKLAKLERGERIALYGFGPTAYYVLEAARHLGFEVYVSTRSERAISRAREHGASWAGNSDLEPMPVEVDAAVVFPPAGPLVEPALRQVKVGGVVVLAPVAMSPISIADYSSHFWGRDIRTLYNVNLAEAQEFLDIAASIHLDLGIERVLFTDLQEAMIRLKHGRAREPNIVAGGWHSGGDEQTPGS
jgi:propanol-preferring alcohol dehydrogenase